MNKTVTAVAVAAAAVFAGVVYFAGREDAPVASNAAPDASQGAAEADDKKPAAQTEAPARAASRTDPTGRPTPADPRLAALMVTPDNGVIEYVKGADGRVIQEIDQDPNSLGYKKPLRQYIYSGDKVVGLTTYRYHAKQVEIIRTAVSYKADGSVDQYQEQTSYEPRR